MKILIHFQPANSDYLFEGARLRKTLKGACESVGVTWGFRPISELTANGSNHLADIPNDILLYL